MQDGAMVGEPGFANWRSWVQFGAESVFEGLSQSVLPSILTGINTALPVILRMTKIVTAVTMTTLIVCDYGAVQEL